MSGHRDHARTDRPDEAGMSLVELAAAMAIASITMGAVVAVLIGTMRTARTMETHSNLAAEGRLAVEAVDRSLRAAARPAGEPAAVLLADTQRVVVYALLNRSGSDQVTDTVPTQVEFAYRNGCLMQTTTAGTRLTGAGTHTFAWTATPSSRCLAHTAVAPQLRYYTSPVLASAGVDTPAMTVPTGGIVDPAVLSSIQAVEMTLTVASTAVGNQAAPATQLLIRAPLANVVGGAVAP